MAASAANAARLASMPPRRLRQLALLAVAAAPLSTESVALVGDKIFGNLSAAEAAETPIPVCAGDASLVSGLPSAPPKDEAVPDFSTMVRETLTTALGALHTRPDKPDIVMFTISKFAAAAEEPDDYNPTSFSEIRQWMCRAKALNLPPVLVACIYKDFADALRRSLPEEDRASIVYLPVRAYVDSKFVDPNCLKFMVAKSIVQAGRTALYSDLDTLWTRDPSELLAGVQSDLAVGLEHQPRGPMPTCLSLPSPVELTRDSDGMNWHEEPGNANTGLLLFRATANAQVALESAVMQCQRRESQEGKQDWLDSDQTSLIAGIQPLCGAGMKCSFLPVTFGKSTWEPSGAPPHVLHFDAFDDKAFVRYLHLRVEGAAHCQAETNALAREVHVLSSPKCGGRSHVAASKQAWRVMSNLDCRELVEESCYDMEMALGQCGCGAAHRKNWCNRLRRAFDEAEVTKRALSGKAWRTLVSKATACIWPTAIANRLPEPSDCTLESSPKRPLLLRSAA